ncbi:MAG: 30S ribosomal protein S2 [Candidatus Zambryskibacteria bacterium RIFCSPHIGHO2_01_FULL_46_30]|uniref:Small ribosomal subunit protein uS2 n=1 Tax=Candidatus Zambryskibacteria bacterium RIFCSPHIGHO2_01_FULL_46_30 TaxID=1802739 RepID=A0A1G2T3Y8_9BACT|nr:MAG: 30S ribosomal protein S2 [Candidatus Zambryskibacteria bacterium RIFCSPHIGHO2_01_FULL_46_30]OHB05800.1 MAG: 30S ribosomal protein S2 [Candidatus Zambryskibacteria bacterium RIFCSPLOWO2_01_FULL_47_33]
MFSALFSVGAHFGFVKSRRHPSAKPFIFGSKNNLEIFDLGKTSKELEKALTFLGEKGREAVSGLWVGGKNEAREAVKKAGLELEMPYVAGRWIGGTLSNFSEIKKRIARLEELTNQKEKGELSKYTKKERLLFDREIEKLTIYFGGLSRLKTMPKFLVVIDPKKEYIAVAEARKIGIPVVALAGSDSNLYELDYAIPGNDSSRQSIAFILAELVAAYKKGLTLYVEKETVTKEPAKIEQ